jgi:hypothetical protein
MTKIQEKVQEIAKIAMDCPEKLQQSCFEILLKHALGTELVPGPPERKVAETTKNDKEEPKSIVEDSAKKQEDLSTGDIHLAARRFLEKCGLSVDHLNQLFYKEGDQVLPLYDDLKTTRTSESQVRISLLQCLHNAIRSGKFQTATEDVRQEAITRKCYDKNNWGNNYSNNAALFDFDKYTKDVTTIALSDQGKKELADLVKELQ